MSQEYGEDPSTIGPLGLEQYRVSQGNGTKPPFTGQYCIDIGSEQRLFASVGGSDSGSRWFRSARPSAPDRVVDERTCVGKGFPGRRQASSLSYYINSASLRFPYRDYREAQSSGRYRSCFTKAVLVQHEPGSEPDS
jgi:peptide-methionine (R)-S-oxide reductase